MSASKPDTEFFKPEPAEVSKSATAKTTMRSMARQASVAVMSAMTFTQEEEEDEEKAFEKVLKSLRAKKLGASSTAAQNVFRDKAPWGGEWAEHVGLGTHPGATVMVKGQRAFNKVNQDFGLVSHPLGGSEERFLFAVYDGHGTNADALSRNAATCHVSILESDVAKLDSDPCAWLGESFLKVDKMLSEASPKLYDEAGCTGIVALLDGSRLSVACLGDSRFVLADHSQEADGPWQASKWSEDQKPTMPEEKARIEAAGGRVDEKPSQDGTFTICRVCHADQPVGSGGLALSRALGDGPFKEIGVIAEPITFELELDLAKTACLVLGCDGVFDFMTNDEVVAICHANDGNASAAARAVINEAKERWKNFTNGEYRDDITCIVAMLPVGDDVIAARRTDLANGGPRINKAAIKKPDSPSGSFKKSSSQLAPGDLGPDDRVTAPRAAAVAAV